MTGMSGLTLVIFTTYNNRNKKSRSTSGFFISINFEVPALSRQLNLQHPQFLHLIE